LMTKKRAHASFVNDLVKLKNEYNQTGGNILVIINTNKMVINWLTNHIKNMDKKKAIMLKPLNKYFNEKWPLVEWPFFTHI
jgi:hemerythrin